MARQPSPVVLQHGRVGLQGRRVGIQLFFVMTKPDLDAGDLGLDVGDLAAVAYKSVLQIPKQVGVTAHDLRNAINAIGQAIEALRKAADSS